MNGADTPAPVATRARIVLWWAERRQKKEIATLAGVSRPTVDLWLKRYAADGIAGLLDRPRGAGREQVPAAIRARILAASRTSPPADTGLSHWSSREMAAFIQRTEGVYVSHHYVAKLWRETGLKPHQQGTFKALLTFLWVGFHDRPGSAGQRPPRVRSAMAISASGLW